MMGPGFFDGVVESILMVGFAIGVVVTGLVLAIVWWLL